MWEIERILLLSDDAAIGFLRAIAMPARLGAMLAAGTVPADIVHNAPPADQVAAICFMSRAQIAAAKAVVEANWETLVGVPTTTTG